MKPYRKKLLESDKSNIRILIEMGLSEKEVLRICKVKIEDLSIEERTLLGLDPSERAAWHRAVDPDKEPEPPTPAPTEGNIPREKNFKEQVKEGNEIKKNPEPTIVKDYDFNRAYPLFQLWAEKTDGEGSKYDIPEKWEYDVTVGNRVRISQPETKHTVKSHASVCLHEVPWNCSGEDNTLLARTPNVKLTHNNFFGSRKVMDLFYWNRAMWKANGDIEVCYCGRTKEESIRKVSKCFDALFTRL
jgi:hypothetical protein